MRNTITSNKKVSEYRVETAIRITRWGSMLYPVHDQYGGGSIELYGEYSPVETKLLMGLLKEGDTVIEGGASFGLLTLPLARAVGPSGRVIAFEPQPIWAMMARANMAMNGIGWADVRAEALAEHERFTRVPILDYKQDANYAIAPLAMWGGRGERTPVTTLDIVAKDLDAVEVIKLDVEGMELEALRGGAKTIARLRPVLFVENDKIGKGAELVRYIREIEYTPYWFVTHSFAKDNFYGSAVDIEDGVGGGHFNMLCLPNERRGPWTAGLVEARETDDNQLACGARLVEDIVYDKTV